MKIILKLTIFFFLLKLTMDADGVEEIHVKDRGNSEELERVSNELLWMLESKAPIIPVFYRVKPSELPWTQGKQGVYVGALLKRRLCMTLLEPCCY